MKKRRFFRQTLDVSMKILSAFVIVFVLYFISTLVNNFAYDYFVFPLISVTVIFVCGVNVGRSLEKIKVNDAIGFFTKEDKKEEINNKTTEFVINDSGREVTNKKVLKEIKDGDKVHIKVFNYNDIIDDKERE